MPFRGEALLSRVEEREAYTEKSGYQPERRVRGGHVGRSPSCTVFVPIWVLVSFLSEFRSNFIESLPCIRKLRHVDDRR